MIESMPYRPGCLLAIVVLASACTRFGFAPHRADGRTATPDRSYDQGAERRLPTDTSSSPDRADDARRQQPDANRDTTQLVDSRGAAGDFEAGAQCSNANIRVSTSGNARSPTFVWSPAGYAVAWVEAGAGARFRRLDAQGRPVGEEILLVTGGASGGESIPGIALNGSHYAVAWAEGGSPSVWLAHFDATGQRVGATQQVTPAAGKSLSWIGLAHDGVNFGLGWVADEVLHFGLRATSGATVGSDATIQNGGAGQALTWTGGQYGLAYASNGGSGCPSRDWTVNLQRIDPQGQLQPLNLLDSWQQSGAVSCGQTSWVRVGGSNYGLAVAFERRDGKGSGQITAVLNALGDKWTPNYPLGATVGSPTMATSGLDIGITWVDNGNATDELLFSRRDLFGNVLVPNAQVNDSPGVSQISGSPWIVWTGSTYAIVWQDSRDGTGGEIYFAQVCL